MRLSHEQFLKRVLASKKLKLEETKIEHRMEIVKFNTRCELLTEEINSIERQLNDAEKS